MTLRIGRIAYLNVEPYFHYLRDAGFCGEIVAGVPAELNAMLAAGAIDVCPSSSYEYGLHADKYCLLPGHSISSIGPVHSVLLFAPEISSLAGSPIVITGESATSVNLLKILLREFCGVEDFSLHVPDGPVEQSLADGQPALLIGDRALAAARECPEDMQVFDLGALWYHFTGLPFVFALWILRREAAEQYPEAVLNLARQLQEARQQAFAHLPEMAQKLAQSSGFSARQLVEYWQGMSYDLTDGHLEGLTLYFTLCRKYGLLETIPDCHFFPVT